MKKLILIVVTAFLYLNVSAQAGLKAGETAPTFTGADNTGTTLDLKA